MEHVPFARLRRLATLTYALIALALLGPSGASAAEPPIVNLAPPNSTIYAPTSSVEVQFTCPRFQTSYDGEKDWGSYWVSFSTSPIRDSEGKFAAQYEIALEHAFPINASQDVCRGFLTEPYTQTPGTYYWMAERINCDANHCREGGPLGSFSIVAPPPPGGTGKQPAGTSVKGGSPKFTAYVACGVGRNAKASSSCGKKQKIGAFFKSTKPVTYKVCVKFPDGKSICAKKQPAQANVLYVNKITGNMPGRHKVTWSAEGRTIVRYVNRRS